MKSTDSLSIVSDYTMDEAQVVIHPNDGYDLELLGCIYPTKIFFNASMDDFKQEKVKAIAGRIILKNECKTGTVEINSHLWQKMENPKKLKLFYSNGKLLLLPDKESSAT